MSTAAEKMEDSAQASAPITAGDELAHDLGIDPTVEAASESSKLFYGWIMLPLAMVMMIATSPGQTFGFSFFNAKFREAFDLSQTRLSATYLVATVLASLALPYVGGLTDRFGLKRSALATIAALAALCVFISQAQGVVTLFLAFMLFRILGPGTLVLLSNNTLASWFDQRLGMATGLMQVAMGGAIAFVPMGTVVLIDAFGWREAYLLIAVILAGLFLPLVALVYRESPAELGQFPDGQRPEGRGDLSNTNAWGLTLAESRQFRAFWILLVASATWALIGTGLVFHVEAIFRAQGLDKAASARAMPCLAMGMVTAQLFGGLLADRIALRWLVLGAMILNVISCTLLALGSAALLIPSFAIAGVAQGTMSIIAGTAWARYFGRAHLGKIRGMSLTAAIAGSSLGPLIMGVSDDYYGGFGPSFWIFVGLAGSVAIASLWATPPERDSEDSV